jgi:hypothetical protein
MKNLIIVLIALIPFVSNCKKDSTPDLNTQIREIAWNSLSSQDKATVNVDWGKAPVTTSTFNGKSTYSVMFNTKDDALLGPITVYVDSSTKVVLGQALRD